MTSPRWTTRAGTADDAPKILALRHAAFGDVDPVRLQPEVWRWQFVDNPAGAGWVRLADDAGTVAGQYAAIPTRFRIGGVERTLAMSCDTMTHPDYQKQGIFVTLARELYAEIAERSGVTTVWGFPNAASHPGFVGKLGWFDVAELPTWVKPLRSRSVLQRYLHSGALAGALGAVADGVYRLVTPRPRSPRRCRIEPIQPMVAFDERFDRLWRRHQDLAPVVQVRDAAFLRWRFGLPAFDYQPFAVVVGGNLEGYFVLRTLTLFDLPFAAIVDLFPCPIVDAEVTREVLGFAQLRAAEQGAAFLTALLPPAHTRHLTRFGFLRVPGFLNLRRWILGCRCLAGDEPVLRPVANWWITYGDADIV